VAVAADVVVDPPEEAWPSGRRCLRVQVSDTGIGIRADDLPTLFQPFTQIDAGLSRHYEGTGLGLAICARLAGLMGGRIEAQSRWGEGSTFVVTLPLEADPR
jgi:signal transduction histidine kinase